MPVYVGADGSLCLKRVSLELIFSLFSLRCSFVFLFKIDYFLDENGFKSNVK